MQLKVQQTEIRLRWQKDETSALVNLKQERSTKIQRLKQKIFLTENTFYTQLGNTDRYAIEKHKKMVQLLQTDLEQLITELEDCKQQIQESKRKEDVIKNEIILLNKKTHKWQHLHEDQEEENKKLSEKKEEIEFNEIATYQKRVKR